MQEKLENSVLHDLQVTQFGGAEGTIKLCQLKIVEKIVLKTNAL